MEIESRYKACTTVGGDSSIQITSCDPFFACLANKWATVLTLLLANSICDQPKPLSRQSTSGRIWPTREDRFVFLSSAVITDCLSPSTTISLKPHSNVNSTARLQARISASSLQATGGPLPENAAKTSPHSF